MKHFVSQSDKRKPLRQVCQLFGSEPLMWRCCSPPAVTHTYNDILFCFEFDVFTFSAACRKERDA
jgi:hypothetical protein